MVFRDSSVNVTSQGPDSRTICEFATFYVTLRYEFQSCEFHICEYSQIGILKQLAKNRSYEFRNCFSQVVAHFQYVVARRFVLFTF